jgi:hypothetical protein
VAREPEIERQRRQVVGVGELDERPGESCLQLVSVQRQLKELRRRAVIGIADRVFRPPDDLSEIVFRSSG